MNRLALIFVVFAAQSVHTKGLFGIVNFKGFEYVCLALPTKNGDWIVLKSHPGSDANWQEPKEELNLQKSVLFLFAQSKDEKGSVRAVGEWRNTLDSWDLERSENGCVPQSGKVVKTVFSDGPTSEYRVSDQITQDIKKTARHSIILNEKPTIYAMRIANFMFLDEKNGENIVFPERKSFENSQQIKI